MGALGQWGPLLCYLATWWPLLAGCGFYSFSLVVLMGPLQALPARLRAGFAVSLGFGRLAADTQSIQNAAIAQLGECNVAVVDCNKDTGNTLQGVRSNVSLGMVAIREAFRNSLAAVLSVANDTYFGTAALAPLASHLGSVLAISTAWQRQSDFCIDRKPDFCSILLHTTAIQGDLGPVQAEVGKYTDGPALASYEEHSAWMLCWHCLPYSAVLSLVGFSVRPKRLFYLCPSRRGIGRTAALLHGSVWALLFLFSTAVGALGLELHFRLRFLRLFWMEQDPALSDVIDHIRSKFPDFWSKLLSGAGDGAQFLLLAALCFEISLVMGAFHALSTCTCRRRTDKAYVMRQLEKDVARPDAWPHAPVKELEELKSLTPCQARALEHVRRHCRRLHLRALPRLRQRAETLGFSSYELDRSLEWIRESAPIIVHVNLQLYGDQLAQDTHYRNQFETRTSGGTLDQKKRARWEDWLFGNAYTEAAPFDRCKYGVLNVINDPQGVRACKQYGYSYLLLRGVRLRTTFSATDSAGMKTDDLATVDYYAHVLERYSDVELQHVLKVGNKRTLAVDSQVLQTYKEAQVHGEVRLADHVELIMAHPGMSASPRDKEVLQSLARRCNTQVVWIEGGVDVPALGRERPMAAPAGHVGAPLPPPPRRDRELEAAILASLAALPPDTPRVTLAVAAAAASVASSRSPRPRTPLESTPRTATGSTPRSAPWTPPAACLAGVVPNGEGADLTGAIFTTLTTASVDLAPLATVPRHSSPKRTLTSLGEVDLEAEDVPAEGPAFVPGAAGGRPGADFRPAAGVRASLPSGWASAIDPASGDTYYFNVFERVSQWERPSLEAESAEGRARAPSGTPPRAGGDLPPGWASAVDPGTGDSYYFNPSTGVSQWDRPVEEEGAGSQPRDSRLHLPVVVSEGGSTRHEASEEDSWEVQVDDGWFPLEGAALVAIRAALASPGQVTSYEARGYKYEIDLRLGVQRNAQTGRRRHLRRLCSADAEQVERL